MKGEGGKALSVECGVQKVKCKMGSVYYEMWSVEREVYECRVWSVGCGE